VFHQHGVGSSAAPPVAYAGKILIANPAGNTSHTILESFRLPRSKKVWCTLPVALVHALSRKRALTAVR